MRAAIIMALAVCSGCAGAGAQLRDQAVQALMPIAAETILQAARDRLVNVDQQQAICTPLPQAHTEQPGVLVVCWAPALAESEAE